MALRCPKCNSTRLNKYGTRFVGHKKRQVVQCQKCGTVTYKPRGSA